jgi:uncharacterized protein YjbI with pentapeptide repeats
MLITPDQLLERYQAGERNFAGVTLNYQRGGTTAIEDVDLSGVNLSGANLTEIRLKRTNLSGSCLQGVCLARSVLVDVNLSHSELPDANLRNCYWVRVDLSNVFMARAILFESCIRDANLFYTNMDEIVLVKSSLRGGFNTEPFRIGGAFIFHSRMPDGTIDEGPRVVDYPN